MIGRLRARAALHLAVVLFFGGWSLTAMATQAVLRSQMESFVYWVFGVGAFALLGAGGAFVSHLMTRMERSMDTAISRLEKAVEITGNDLLAHNNAPLAHVAASEHNHGPMTRQSDRIEEKVDELTRVLHDLVRDHNRIQGQEGEICSALAELRRRNPADSNPKRKDDSGPDYTPLRGKE